MASHARIRILLAIAVAVICGGVFVVTEVQRRSDATTFEQYACLRELRGAAMQTALAIGDTAVHGTRATGELERVEDEVIERVQEVSGLARGRGDRVRALLAEQETAAESLAQIAREVASGARVAQLSGRRDAMLERFVEANNGLLSILAVERREARRDAARRPVLLVVGLFVLFGVLHLALVEGPAKREHRRRRAQDEFGAAMQVARSEPEAYSVLSRHVERVAAGGVVTVLNRNNSADRLEAVTPVDPESPTGRGLAGAEPDSCLAVRLARTHRRAPADEPLMSCEVCGKSPEQTTCVPSIVGGEVVGSVLVEHRRPLGGRLRVVEESVAEAAPVVANLRNLAVAEMRAATDGLTGLPNQRSVHETLKRAAAQAGRTASPVALVLFDLDHFKSVNDTHGHGKGDELLAAVGAAAGDALRASDFVGRLGGEEFAALLPDTGLEGAVQAAEKLRGAIAAIEVPGVDRRVTASFGVAVLPDDAGEPDLLLRAADRALYAAKGAGRNRVQTAAGAPAAIA